MSHVLQHEIRHLQSLEGSPRDPDGRIFLPLADAHLRAGEHETAEALLVDGLARHPDFVAAHVLAARLREAQGNLDGAELAWAAARRLDPENVEVLYGLGRIMAARGEEIGVSLVEKARALDPTAGRGPGSALASLETAEAPAVAVEDESDVVSIADLAPDEALVAIDEVTAPAASDDESDVVSIADLAPDSLPGDDPPAEEVGDPVSIVELAPEPAEEVEAEEEVTSDDGSYDAEPEPEPESPASAEPAASDAVVSSKGGNGNGERGVVTRTLAELLVTQGQRGQAIRMYETLVEREPSNDGLRDRLEELRGADPEEPSVEDDAHHLPSAPDPVPDAPTPFAWTGAGEDDEEAGPDSGPPIADYFDGLLAWSPSQRADEDA